MVVSGAVGLLFLGNCCLCDSGNILLQFISGISFSCLTCTFEVVLAGCAAAVLRIYFVVFDKPFEVQFGFVKIVLDSDGLVLPLCHLLFVEVVGRVHLLEVKLELVFVGDDESEALDANLVVVEAFSEGCEVDLTVPLCVVCQAQIFLGVDVERTPSCFEMLEDLYGGCVAVGGVDALEL